MSEFACVFCDIVAGRSPARYYRQWPDVIAIEPRDPVTDGHLLVIPKAHVNDALEDPAVTASVMHRAAEIGERPCNLIANCGDAASQTVFHLHVHVVPRRVGDRLTLPWTRPPTVGVP